MDCDRLLVDALRAEQHYPPYRFVLEFGRSLPAAPLPPEVADGPPMCCFANAFGLATAQPDTYSYYEGYATLTDSPNWPTRHAWCVNRDAQVIDPTWSAISGRRARIAE